MDCGETTPGLLRISVKDNGDGLSSDKLAQLFQPFNRLGRVKDFEPGTGIGLVICKRLVEMMGGNMGTQPPLAPIRVHATSARTLARA